MQRDIAQNPAHEVYGDLEVVHAVVQGESEAGQENLRSAGFMSSILLFMFIVDRTLELLSINRYAVSTKISRTTYSILPGLIAYGALSLLLLVVATRYTSIFLSSKTSNIARLLTSTGGLFLIIVSIVPLTTAVLGQAPIGFTANYFGDMFDPMESAYGPFAAGLALVIAAKFLPQIRLR